MRFSFLSIALLSFLPSVSAFVSTSPVFGKSAGYLDSKLFAKSDTELTTEPIASSVDRRSALLSIFATSCTLASGATLANASLLDEYGSDPTKINNPETKVEAVVPKGKVESTIEPNLRSNYYYPTNKKRYLPRIKKCNDAIPEVATLIGNEDWEAVNEFAMTTADDTILPMKLYTSSLTGGGTNVKVSFTKDMMNSAESFEKSHKALLKAIKKKDQTASSQALEGMATAMQSYRTSGKLLGPDGGGDIPSVDDIRRSACRVQGRTFEKKVKDRDARLAANSGDI